MRHALDARATETPHTLTVYAPAAHAGRRGARRKYRSRHVKRYTVPTRGKKFGAFVFAFLAAFVALVAISTAIDGYRMHQWIMIFAGLLGTALGAVGLVTSVAYAYRQDNR